MEVYTLDPLLRRDEIVDQFESLIWTERFNKAGDFEMVIRSTPDTRRIFKNGLLLACNLSHRVMIVQSVENNADAAGKRTLRIKGPSLESILEDRAALAALGSTTTYPTWSITGTPGAIMRKIFHDICVTGVLNVADKVPFINEGNVLFPVSTIAESATSITINLDPTTVLQAEQDLGTLYDLGFRLYRNYDTSALYFDVYSGSDRRLVRALCRLLCSVPSSTTCRTPRSMRPSRGQKTSPTSYLQLERPRLLPRLWIQPLPASTGIF
jgi:hypothetical protein